MLALADRLSIRRSYFIHIILSVSFTLLNNPFDTKLHRRGVRNV